ncbi:AI-2E family transporter [Haloarcula marina]|uniref:AI-2E family transporter n=1 Tax=Haloarcula marina TaxID=2961574 RepID=UPI0032AFA2C4
MQAMWPWCRYGDIVLLPASARRQWTPQGAVESVRAIVVIFRTGASLLRAFRILCRHYCLTGTSLNGDRFRRFPHGSSRRRRTARPFVAAAICHRITMPLSRGTQSCQPPMTDSATSNTFLTVFLLLVGVLSVLLAMQFFQAIVLGGLLAYLVAPVNSRLSRRLGDTGGALVTTLGTIVVVLAPLALLLAVAVEQAVAVAQGVELPNFADVLAVVIQWFGTSGDLSTLLGSVGDAFRTAIGGLLGRVVRLIGGVTAFLVGVVVFLFTFYYLLRDGDDFVEWVRAAIPFDEATTDELVDRTDHLLWAAVVGNVIVAGVQALLTVLGFLVLGFDNLVFWGVVTFGLSMLPLIGASIIWIPAVVYLAAVGDVVAAAGLAIYGAVIVSGSDNFIRPLAMQRGAQLNPALIVIGIFGGVVLFGFLGLFIGPVVLGLAKTLVELLVADRTDAPGI